MSTIIQKHYIFPQMNKKIKKFNKTCEVCIQNKTRKPQKLGKLGHLGPASKPFAIMSLDTIGGFGGRRSTKRYMHLVIDHFTRFAFILTSSTQSTKDFIKLISKIKTDDNAEIEILLADQYPAITSDEFQNYLEKENINLILTAVDSPFSNGLNERLNQTLINRLRCKINSLN